MAASNFPDFVWSVGEEGSDPWVMSDGARVRMDQFAASGHYDSMEADHLAIASLGVDVVRYGTPWRLAEPAPGEYDWSLWDRAFASCDAAGLEPIVEFVHFGLPDHYDGFVPGDWIDGFCRYVDAFLDRYCEPRWFTPINEPGITARMSARLGLWNDMETSRTAHAAALANVTLANLEAIARIRADREGWWIGSEGFDIPVRVAGDLDETTATQRVDRMRAVTGLIWDLHLGVAPAPAAEGYLDRVPDSTRDRIAALTVRDQLIAGFDIYPISIHAIGGERPDWGARDLITIAATEIERWHERYAQPFWIAETSNLTLPVDQQIEWLDSLYEAMMALRSSGLPARGICWYSRGDQFDWQTALTNPVGAVTEVGLFDADRVARPVAARFREHAQHRAST